MTPTDTNTQAAFRRCLPALRTNVDEVGSMTICDAIVPEPDTLDTLFTSGPGDYDYYLMKDWYRVDMQGKACRAKVNSFYDYLMSQRVSINAKFPGFNAELLDGGRYRIRPYVLVKREQPLNNKYWLISNGALASADGTNPGDGTHWEMDLTSDAGVPPDVNWFHVGSRIFAATSSDGVISNTAWKVVSATVVGNAVRVIALPQNAGSYYNSGAAYAVAAPPAGLASPVTGIAERGTVNKSAFESFCQQTPGLISDTFDPFFIEETRHTFEWDEQWAEWEKAVAEQNDLFANLYRLERSKHQKQAIQDFQERFVNAFLYQKPISLKQNINEFNDLDLIDTIVRYSASGVGTYCIGRRANATGIFEQMVQAGRVVQLNNDRLNLVSLFGQFYEMMRTRATSNPKAENLFEVTGPSSFFPLFNQGMLEYYKVQTGNNLVYHMDISQQQKVSPLGFVYQDYKVLYPANITIRWIHNAYHLDDRLAAANRLAAATGNPADAALGRQLWIMDWSQAHIGVLASERVTREVGGEEGLRISAQTAAAAACTMKAHKRFIEMTGMAYTVWHDCPAGDLILQGFSDEVPMVTGGGPVYGAACNVLLG